MLRQQSSATGFDSMLQRLQSVSSEAVLEAKRRNYDVKNVTSEPNSTRKRLRFTDVSPVATRESQFIPPKMRSNSAFTPQPIPSPFPSNVGFDGLLSPNIQVGIPVASDGLARRQSSSFDYLLYASEILLSGDRGRNTSTSFFPIATPLSMAPSLGDPKSSIGILSASQLSRETSTVSALISRIADEKENLNDPPTPNLDLEPKPLKPLKKRSMKVLPTRHADQGLSWSASMRPQAAKPSFRQERILSKVANLRTRPISETARSCRCQKNRCLRLYCECFASNQLCDPKSCQCGTNCCNDSEDNAMRLSAVAHALKKNKHVFDTERATRKERKAAMLDEELSIRKCSCRKSRCLKRYCECFHVGAFCGKSCQCQQCENFEGSAALCKIVSRKRKRKEIPIEPLPLSYE